jgi:ABC-type multidrug transport system permease subunit
MTSIGALLYFAVVQSSFGSALEVGATYFSPHKLRTMTASSLASALPQILTLFAQRPIVERHKRYAFYHPSAEAFASMLTDLPYKVSEQREGGLGVCLSDDC